MPEMSKFATTIGLVIGLFLAGPVSHVQAWNETGHRLYLEKAIDALPNPLKNFYKDRKTGLSEAMTDWGLREARLTFELDMVDEFPFDKIPADKAGAIRLFGEDKVAELGDLPWRVTEKYNTLVEAFKAKDFEQVQQLSIEIAYMIGELNVPGNVSTSGDGEPTGQLGLRERFDSGLIDAFASDIKIDTPSAVYLDRPAEYAVAMPRKSYVWVDNLLHYDELSRRGVSSYDRFYYDGLWRRSETLVEDLLENAALDTASFWYTAWVAARKPELPKR